MNGGCSGEQTERQLTNSVNDVRLSMQAASEQTRAAIEDLDNTLSN